MYSLEKNLNLRSRTNQPGGNTIYLCDYANVQSIVFDSTSTYISGITMVNNNKFYKYELPKGNINFSNNVQISVPNACYVMNPLLNFNAPGLKASKMKLYDFLTRKSVIAIVRTNMNQYFVLGAQNGIDMQGGSNFTSGKAGVELIGANYSLSGAETIRITEIDPAVVSSIMGSIVYVNVPMSLSATTAGISISLTWNFGDEDEYPIHLERSLDGTGFTEIYVSSLNEYSYLDTDIEEETEYFYRYWIDNGMEIKYSNTFSIWSTYCQFILSITNTTDHEIDLLWDYGCHTKRNAIEIERSLDGTGYTLYYSTPTGATTFNDTGLTFSTDFYYRIRMYLSTKYSRYSNIVNDTTLYYPLSLSGVSSLYSIELSWDFGSWDINTMIIERSYSGNTGFTEIQSIPTGTTTFTDSGLTSGTTYYYRIRTYDGNIYSDYSSVLTKTTLGTAGLLDTSFMVGSGFTSVNVGFPDVLCSALDSNDNIYVGGTFSGFNGTEIFYLCKIDSGGTLDTSFTSYFTGGTSTYVKTIKLDEPNDKLYIGGLFSNYNNKPSTKNMARLNLDGSVDLTFNSGGTGSSGQVDFIDIDNDDKIYVGGNFTYWNSDPSRGLAKLNSNGTFDSSWTIGTNITTEGGFVGTTRCIYIYPDDKVLVGGGFTKYSGNTINYLIKLNVDGSRDTSFPINNFDTSTNGVTSIYVDSNDKIFITGDFDSYSGSTSECLIKLNEDGTIDTSLNTDDGFDRVFSAAHAVPVKVIIDNNSNLYVIGDFNRYSGSTYNKIVRLTSGGTYDTLFNSGETAFGDISLTNGYPLFISLTNTNKLIVTGGFNIYNDVSVGGIVRITT